MWQVLARTLNFRRGFLKPLETPPPPPHAPEGSLVFKWFMILWYVCTYEAINVRDIGLQLEASSHTWWIGHMHCCLTLLVNYLLMVMYRIPDFQSMLIQPSHILHLLLKLCWGSCSSWGLWLYMLYWAQQCEDTSLTPCSSACN